MRGFAVPPALAGGEPAERRKEWPGSWSGQVESNEVVLAVKEAPKADAGKPVDGLQLTMSADRTETSMKADGGFEPFKLTLTFTNVGDQPLKLNTYFPLQDFTSASPEQVILRREKQPIDSLPRPVRAEDVVTLKPKEKWTGEAYWPGPAGSRYAVRNPAKLSLVRTYAFEPTQAEREAHPFFDGVWTGRLKSNEVSLTIKEAPKADAGKPTP
jgi:hypothetical protein